MRVLVVSVSARMLAQLAVADGYEVVALDRFGDVDLRAIAPCAVAPNMDGLVALAEDVDAEAVVYGAGLENRPDLVARLAAGRELLGTPPELLPAVRDPWALPWVPETRRTAPRSGDWLRKPLRGGGGRGVRPWDGGRLKPTEILQRRVDGLACSAVAVGNGVSAVLLGVTEQLHRGYRWEGNARISGLEHRFEAICAEVVARFGVRGAFSVDAVWDGDAVWVLEVNPRPTASLELFGPGTFELHVRGARGEPLDALPAVGPRAKLVLFAPRALRAPHPSWWPAEARDIPHDDEPIGAGRPVCTLVADTTPDVLRTQGARLLAALTEAAVA